MSAPVQPDPLASPTDLAKVALGQVDEATAVDLLGRASEIVRGYCGSWGIAEQDYDLTRDGKGRDLLMLPALKVTAVTSVVEAGTVLVEDVDFDWSESGVLERIGGAWPSKRRSVRVQFTAGYNPVPRDVVAVVTGLTARVLATPGGMTQQRIGSMSLAQTLTAGGGLDDYEKAILDRYRIRR